MGSRRALAWVALVTLLIGAGLAEGLGESALPVPISTLIRRKPCRACR